MFAERLEDRTLFNVVIINGTAGDDTITVTSSRVLFLTFVDYTVNGASGSAVVSGGDSVLVDTGTGRDTVNIQSTVVPTDVVGHSLTTADDTLNIGDGSGVQDIGAALQAENPSGYWNINVNNAPDAGARTETIGSTTISGSAYGQITGMAPAQIAYKYGDTRNVVIHTGGGADTVNVLATGGVGYTWLQGDANATVNVGNGNTRSIAAELIIENSPAFDTLTVDDSADTTARSISLDTVLFTPAPGADNFERIQGLAPSPILFEWKDLSNTNPTTILAGSGGNTVLIASLVPDSAPRTLNLFTGTGNDATTVDQVGTAATLDIHGQNGADSVTVPASAAQSITGTLSVDNTISSTAITIDDSTDSTARTVTLDTFTSAGSLWEKITGLTPGTIEYRGFDVTAPTIKAGPAGNTFNILNTTPFFVGAPDKTLTLDTGIGNDVVNVQNTAATGTLLLDGNNGIDAVNIGNAGSVQGINGAINIQNHPDFTATTIDDSADTTARTVTLDTSIIGTDTWQSISGLAPAVISYDGNDATAPTIKGGSGGNTFNVLHTTSFNSAAASKVLTLQSGAGSDTVFVSGASAPLAILGQAGNDSITLDFSGAGINGDIAVDGGAGLNNLTLQGAAPPDPFTVTATTVTHGAVTVNYTSIQTLVLDPGAFTVTADLAGMNVITQGAGTTAQFMTTQHLGGLNIGGDTQATLQSSPAPAGKTIFCTDLAIAPSGSLNLTNNALQLNYGALPDPIATVRALVTSGYNGGTWTGHGINSSSADATHALGFGDAADGAVTGLPAQNILVRFTRYGDVNLDGVVGFADLLLLAQHYGQSNQNWDQGDQTYDGIVGFPDLLKLAQNYGAVAAVSPGLAATAPQFATTAHAVRRRHA